MLCPMHLSATEDTHRRLTDHGMPAHLRTTVVTPSYCSTVPTALFADPSPDRASPEHALGPVAAAPALCKLPSLPTILIIIPTVCYHPLRSIPTSHPCMYPFPVTSAGLLHCQKGWKLARLLPTLFHITTLHHTFHPFTYNVTFVIYYTIPNPYQTTILCSSSRKNMQPTK